MQQAMEILIIGAGPTGLLLAQGLKAKGIKATIFERETPELYHNRPREWGLSLHWGAEAINKVLPPDLQARISEVLCNPYFDVKGYGGLKLKHYAGHSGEFLFEVPMPEGGMRVSRSKVKNLFSAGVESKYGKTLASITQADGSVIAHFEDGTSATGALIIGCDGGKSVVRRMLVGEQQAQNTHLDFNLFNFTCHFDVETSQKMIDMHPIFFNSHHKNGYMLWFSAQDVADAARPETWLWQIMFFWRGAPRREDFEDQEARMRWLKARAEEYVEPWRSVLKAVPDDVRFGVDRIAIWEPVDWSSAPLAGRVTLAGDAAHPMPPYRGQGMNNGLEDAALLVESLSKIASDGGDLAAALRKYEFEMRERAVKEIAMSTRAANLAHEFDQLMDSPLVKMGVRRS